VLATHEVLLACSH